MLYAHTAPSVAKIVKTLVDQQAFYV